MSSLDNQYIMYTKNLGLRMSVSSYHSDSSLLEVKIARFTKDYSLIISSSHLQHMWGSDNYNHIHTCCPLCHKKCVNKSHYGTLMYPWKQSGASSPKPYTIHVLSSIARTGFPERATNSFVCNMEVIGIVVT